ncbi:uncharacterized protein [Venturia canescens]|uniref:uncharacterized protein n=1 Tax=Venturia canescens TaxID=32260 RepID=UPI001C9CFCEC|nr:uncharacterized protein LOC122406087 [Venturia canescens]
MKEQKRAANLDSFLFLFVFRNQQNKSRQFLLVRSDDPDLLCSRTEKYSVCKKKKPYTVRKMSKTAHLEEEDSSWAQTFFTVTPQDDGFLREIEDTAVVSGKADEPLNLDTWNIVLRRSLLNTTKNLIDPKELEKPERIATETQTYLQGVPRVDLPLAYRDEATQTLFMGKDEKCPTEKVFDDIITVMNEKPLPEWRKSQYVQTTITFANETSLADVISDLEKLGSEEDPEESEPIPSAAIESLDALNFVVDRAVWMSEAVPIPKAETKEAEVETMIKFNHALQRLTTDQEVQTELSCDPKLTNLMLVPDIRVDVSELQSIYRKTVASDLTKNDRAIEAIDFRQKSIESDETDTDIAAKDSGREIFQSNLKKDNTNIRRKDFGGESSEKIVVVGTKMGEQMAESSSQTDLIERSSWRVPVSSGLSDPRRNHRSFTHENERTKSILLADANSYVSRNPNEAARDPNLRPACSSRESIRSRRSIRSSSENEAIDSSLLSPRTSRQIPVKCEQNLPAHDERALRLLRDTFCTRNGPEDRLPKRDVCRCIKIRELSPPSEIL